MKIPGGRFVFLILSAVILVVFSALTTSVYSAPEDPPTTMNILNIITAPCPDGSRRDSEGRCRKALN